MNDTQHIIDLAWERRADITALNAPEVRERVESVIADLNRGRLRVAEREGVGQWRVNQWVKKAVLLSFRLNDNRLMRAGDLGFYDKVPTKFAHLDEEQLRATGVRIVPPAVARRGSYIARNVVLMPSYVNIGAYVDEGTMVDTWATVGSCAQIGRNVHLSGGVGIGGVLEPLQANPTIIEDNCFIGARSEIVEGVIVEENSVISMGVYIGQSTKIYNRMTGEVGYGRVPAGSVVVSGSLPAADGSHSLYCAVIVKRVTAETRAKTSINELLRSGVNPREHGTMSGNMERVLRLMAEKSASDVYISANTPILIKIHGQILQLSDQLVTPTQIRQLLSELLSPQQMEELTESGELNVGVAIAGVGSFRISGFRQRGSIAAVIRCIPRDIPALDTLGVPAMLSTLVVEPRGLILMVGATGTGKSTTLASMIEWRNQQMAGHILTIEEPIEFLFSNKRSIVNQREVGRDTQTLQVALKNALRQAPDCIMIGEIRDRETMTSAISYALSGHLVLATLHANNSYHALGRILSFYTPEARPTLLSDLSSGLRAIISQRLLRANAGGRVPAVEVMLNTKLVAELIEKGDLSGVKEAMEKSLAEGSQTFEQDIARLINQGVVSRDEGLAQSDSPTNLLWRLQNEMAPVSRAAPKRDEPDSASFTELTIEVRPEEAPAAANATPWGRAQ